MGRPDEAELVFGRADYRLPQGGRGRAWSEVGVNHRSSQPFTWRRELRYVAESAQRSAMSVPEPTFKHSVIEPVPERANLGRMQRRRGSSTAVELEIDGIAVMIARGADAGVIAAAIDALSTTR